MYLSPLPPAQGLQSMGQKDPFYLGESSPSLKSWEGTSDQGNRDTNGQELRGQLERCQYRGGGWAQRQGKEGGGTHTVEPRGPPTLAAFCSAPSLTAGKFPRCPGLFFLTCKMGRVPESCGEGQPSDHLERGKENANIWLLVYWCPSQGTSVLTPSHWWLGEAARTSPSTEPCTLGQSEGPLGPLVKGDTV